MWENVNLKKSSTNKLYTGKAKVKVVGINPTKEELSKILNIQEDKLKEPEYSNDRIVVYVKNDKLVAKGTFFVSMDDTPVSKTGKTKYLNNYQQSTYLENPDDTSEQNWFSRTGLRVCKSGEDSIYNFIINWVGVDTSKGEFVLPYENICNGDITILKQALIKFADNEFVVVLGVSNNKYQEFFTKEFGMSLSKNFSKIQWNKVYYTTDEIEVYTIKEEPDALETSAESATDLPF